jgi:hypothetical protein
MGKKGERERGKTELTKGERNFSIRERSKKQRGKLEENNKRTELVGDRVKKPWRRIKIS